MKHPSSWHRQTPTPPAPRSSRHSTGVGDRGRWSNRRIAMDALLTALSMALSFISLPLFPAAPFLKYDPSAIVALLAGLVYGPASGGIVGVLGFLPHFFTNPLGALINILVMLALVLPPSLVARHHAGRAPLAASLLLGGILEVALALLLNLLFTPLYARMTLAQVASLILPVLLPFNLLKAALDTVCAFLLYRPLKARLPR